MYNMFTGIAAVILIRPRESLGTIMLVRGGGGQHTRHKGFPKGILDHVHFKPTGLKVKFYRLYGPRAAIKSNLLKHLP